MELINVDVTIGVIAAFEIETAERYGSDIVPGCFAAATMGVSVELPALDAPNFG